MGALLVHARQAVFSLAFGHVQLLFGMLVMMVAHHVITAELNIERSLFLVW
jgi:hypothetical protein